MFQRRKQIKSLDDAARHEGKVLRYRGEDGTFVYVKVQRGSVTNFNGGVRGIRIANEVSPRGVDSLGVLTQEDLSTKRVETTQERDLKGRKISYEQEK